jgi:magnesium transporter
MISLTLKKITKKTGLPPGTLVHTGEKIVEKPKIDLIIYNELDLKIHEIKDIGDLPDPGECKEVTWINIEGVHDPEIIKAIGEKFSIHILVLEDILNTSQRPKVEEYNEYTYITVRNIFPCQSEDNGITEAQTSIILSEKVVISFCEFGSNILSPLIQRIKNSKGRIRTKKADYLAYAILDTIVDQYFLVLEDFGKQIETLEDEIFESPSRQINEKLHILKRELSFTRKAVWPLREVINIFLRDEVPFVSENSVKYFRDVYDHTVQIIETLESLRDIVSGLFDIYLSSISHRMNEVMKVLTIIATIFIPLSFIAGVYGMNFQYMPELAWKWGYFIILGFMGALGFGMAIYFKIKEWF